MNWTGIGALVALLGVGTGAFGAHTLKARLSVEMLQVFEVGVRYQMYHAFALMVLGLTGWKAPAAGWCFLTGTVVFSGSLYVLSMTGIRVLGAVTPVGGVLFLIGWALLARAAFTSTRRPNG